MSCGSRSMVLRLGRPLGAALLGLGILAVGNLPGITVPGVTVPSARAQSAADIQWAQTHLRDKGYNIGGRPNGQMTSQTRNALSVYQKANGLPVTGTLDQATTARMMAERGTKTSPQVNNLAQQRQGGGGPGQEPRQARETAPRAAPTQRVQAGTETVGSGPAFGSIAAGPSAGAGVNPGPAMQAAPRGSVDVTGADGTSGQAATDAFTGTNQGLLPDALRNQLIGGARWGVIGIIAVMALGLLFAFWRSGRRVKERRPPAGAVEAPRRMPRFEVGGTAARPREELSAGALPPIGSGRGR